MAGQDKESQEVSVLALHLLQSALVHVNTLLMQQVLAGPKGTKGTDALTEVDRRVLSPLLWTHVDEAAPGRPCLTCELPAPGGRHRRCGPVVQQCGMTPARAPRRA
ncbi:Tn3 family transposase [Streptomyces boncukensis]|uniref:Tn3 family transposase n=1 Tax=Streptomyces boncukensis TaxID=2711219 RepID=UPI0024084FF6|nr:Tn3 family transposase [Streptomyces boncukensis]